MPLDSRIILGAGQGVQPIDTPLEIEAKRAALGQVRQKALDDQQARAADNAFRQALQATGGDYDAAIQQSEQQGFNMLPIREAIQKQRNTILDGVKKGLDNEKLSSDLLSRLMQNVHSQQDWQTIAPLAARIDPEFVRHAGSTYDQQRFDAFRNIGVDADKQFEAVQKAHEDYNAGKGEEGFRKSLLATQDDEDLAGAIQVAKGWGVGDAVIRKYLPQGAKWSPELVQRAAQLSITPEKQAELGLKAADDVRQAAVQAETARHNRAEEGLGAGNLAVRRQEAAKAAKGEGGRGVTSGDAGKLADMDASIAQLRELKQQFGGNNPSGIMANVETYLPPGLGTAAKSKQAKIDIVRQLVGKGLEGGVLRKEDEVKYAKILPIVSDNDALAASKIDGAIAAIEQKKADHLDALQDAGYDTSRFRARQQAKPQDTKKKNPFR